MRFAQSAFFGDLASATDAIERINRIHRGVEDTGCRIQTSRNLPVYEVG
ncbi:MAG: hypothetical protein M3Q62_00590 [Actinomycetota bacterium]|nr:hypothetical protein [Actinomycetota bacterium]